MEESKKRQQAGNKVSKIANIFQGMPSREEEEMRGSDVTVVRTESHLARFNNARALFEKLGEENRGFRIEKSPSAAASFAGTRGFPAAAPTRSRSSSAGSVSPPRRNMTPTPILVATAVNGDRLANGASQPPPKPAKPSVLPKPEKPDRRFNKELIEKQRNWTAHFNKSRTSRHDHEQRVDSKYPSGYQDRKSPEAAERYVVPSRVYSPPLSPCGGDTQVERPNTLPTSLVSRGIPGAKSPSPIKTIPSVSPSSRANNIISPNLRTEVIVSPTVRKESLSSSMKTDVELTPEHVEPTALQAEPFERVSSKARSSVSPVKDEIDKTVEYDESSLSKTDYPQSPNSITKPTEIPLPSSPTTASTVVDPVLLPRRQMSPPTPTARSPKSPLPPLPIEEKPLPVTIEPSVSPLPEESEPTIDFIDSVTPEPTSFVRSEALSQSPVPIEPLEEKSSDRQSIAPESPEPYDSVVSTEMPVTISVDDDYEPVQFSGEWEEKSKRRSSTPESTAGVVEAGDAPQSLLASPLASPVHHLSSSPPAAASPSPGKLIMINDYQIIAVSIMYVYQIIYLTKDLHKFLSVWPFIITLSLKKTY